MADVKIIPTVAETRERTTIPPDTRLNQLTNTVVKNGRKAVAAAAFAVLSTVSGSAYAADTPNTPSTSANASADKRAWQMVTLKDGRVMSFAELFAEEQKTGKNVSEEIEDRASRKAYLKYSSSRIDVALNQTAEKRTEVGQALNQEQKRLEQDQKALNQINALYDLMDQLFAEQGPQVSGDKKYESRAIIVKRVLDNPILTEKFTPDTINLLKDMEWSLSRWKNPFIYMSPSGKAKLRAMLKA